MRSSSVSESSPTARLPSAHLSNRIAQRTYSKRSSIHIQKRKEEAELSDEEDTEASEHSPVPRRKTDVKLISQKSKAAARRVSDVEAAKKTGGQEAAVEDEEEEGIEEREEREDFPPFALKNPSPLAKKRFSSTISPDPSLSPSAHDATPPPPSPPSPSPTARKRARTGLERQARDASPTSTRRKVQATNGKVPEVQIQLSTSSPSHSQPFKAPTTPPRSTPRANHPVTPKSSPRNLQGSVGTQSPSSDVTKSPMGTAIIVRRPGGMRRMLTKTQSLGIAATSPKADSGDVSDSSFARAGPSTPTRLNRTQSMPESPARAVDLESVIDPAALLMPAIAPIQDGSGGRAKRTYGKSRSYLAEASQAAAVESVSAVVQPDMIVKESYEELRRKYEVDNTGLEGTGSGNLMSELMLARAPQTVTDMQSRGENRRFMDELGYLLEGITDPGASQNSKRTSAVEILRNMQDETWRSKMAVCGQVERIWEVLSEARDEGDEVLDIICLLVLRTISVAATSLDSLLQIHASSIVRLLLDSLKIKENILAPSNGVRSSSVLQRLREIAHELDPNDPNPPYIASTLLNVTCSLSWDVVATEMLSARALPRILRAFSAEAQPLASRFDLHEKGLALLPEGGLSGLPHIHNIVRVLSILVVASQQDREDLIENRQYILDDLVACLLAGSVIHLNQADEPVTSISSLTVELLQMLANLTNVSQSWSSGLSTISGGLTTLARIMLRRDEFCRARNAEEESMSTETSDHEEEADVSGTKPEEIMCLILAILTTVCVGSVAGTEAVAAIEIGATCTGAHSCLRQCGCDDAESFVEYLVDLYKDQLSAAGEATSSVMTGYLALLLARIATRVGSARELISSSLPGQTPRDRLGGMLVSLSELKGLHSLVQRKLKDMSGEADSSGDEGGVDLLKGEADVVQTVSNELTEIIQRT